MFATAPSRFEASKRRPLPGNVTGAMWVVLGALLLTVTGALVKELGPEVNPFQVTLFRGLFGLAFVLPPALAQHGASVLRTGRPALQAVRGGVSALAMTAGFYAVAHLPLATATAITFTSPLFITVLAFIVLRERLSLHRWAATAVGLVGAWIIVRPMGTIEPAVLVAVLGALAVGAAKLFIKELARWDGPSTILIYLGVSMVVVSAVPALINWQPLTARQLVLLAAVGGVAMAAQACVVRGYRAAEASVLAPMEYSRLIFASLIGLAVFAEVPDGRTLIGAAIIIGGALFVASRERRTTTP